MEWRVPKVKGMLTPRNIVTAAVLILIFSIPFGFLGSHAQFAVFTSFLPLTFMSVSFLGFLLLPFLPGSKVELKQEAIVRPGSRWDDRSAYRDIHCCYYIRECTWAKDKDGPITNVHEGDFEGPAFTSFLVFMKGEPQVTSGCMLSGASRRLEPVLNFLKNCLYIVFTSRH